MTSLFKTPKQLLKPQDYYSDEWFQREKRDLFDVSWVYACNESALKEPGDFVTLKFMDHPLFVVREVNGGLRAYHNICRHRGCQVLEGAGNTAGAIVCPYHRWTYESDGSLRGVPNEIECFDELDRESLSLHPASVGVYAGMVFVNPSPQRDSEFEDWIGSMNDHAWPHDLSSLGYKGSVSYEMQCNWKLFYENAVDGYHLGYLHDRTLGKVYPSKNVWEPVGDHVVWYSTEQDGKKKSNTLLTSKLSETYGSKMIPGAEMSDYPGVVMLFPLTIVSPSPWGFYVSVLEPAGPELTFMHSHSFGEKDEKARDRAWHLDEADIVRLSDLETHPLESGNFQIEDMWIVEKIQRNIRSPHYQVGPLARGDGAESPLTHFQETVLRYVN